MGAIEMTINKEKEKEMETKLYDARIGKIGDSDNIMTVTDSFTELKADVKKINNKQDSQRKLIAKHKTRLEEITETQKTQSANIANFEKALSMRVCREELHSIPLINEIVDKWSEQQTLIDQIYEYDCLLITDVLNNNRHVGITFSNDDKKKELDILQKFFAIMKYSDIFDIKYLLEKYRSEYVVQSIYNMCLLDGECYFSYRPITLIGNLSPFNCDNSLYILEYSYFMSKLYDELTFLYNLPCYLTRIERFKYRKILRSIKKMYKFVKNNKPDSIHNPLI